MFNRFYKRGYLIFLVLLITFSALAVRADDSEGEYDLIFHNLRVDEGFFVPQVDVTTRMMLENEGIDLENVRVTVVIPELGLRKRLGLFDLSDDDEILKQAVLDLEDNAIPGFYTARITITDTGGNFRRVKHREFQIS